MLNVFIFVVVFMTIANTAGASAALGRSASRDLSKIEAEGRSGRISNVKYDLKFSFDDKAPNFAGTESISFSLNQTPTGAKPWPLTIDFGGGTVESVLVNGKSSLNYNKFFISLPEAHLKSGDNLVEIRFSHPYSTTGAGLYRFKDVEDGKVYLYSDFEPYDANSMFPCFDQPDLKATYKLAVEVPKEWTVISSVREGSIADVPSKKVGRSLWTFPESARFSTYLLELAAGPYEKWESTAGKIPLRLFSRASVAKYVKHEEWFTITKQGLEFFGKFFGYDYPFIKYDQVIVPDFNSGAMENVAAVTFSEKFLSRGIATYSEREDHASVILHEMAHMWFGDLVTMKWWNDLWLNESFATYMAALALVESTEFKGAWLSFQDGDKQWAYTEDQQITTHPIEGIVQNTKDAFASFDGITYGKGASVLKQLHFYLGQTAFQQGVQTYFKRHEFANATLSDFMGALGEAAGKDLSGWTEAWLRTSGVNTVESVIDCREGKIRTFKLKQTSTNGQIRMHRSQIGIYRLDADNKLKFQRSEPISYDKEEVEVTSLTGELCPAFVNPNEGDFDYVKVKLDYRSLGTAKRGLALFENTLLRSMTWSSLWEMVRDDHLGVTDFADIVLTQGINETDLNIAQRLATDIHGRRRNSLSSIMRFLPALPDGEDSPTKQKYARSFEDFFMQRFKNAEPGSDLQRIAFDGLVRVAVSKDALSLFKDMLAGKGLPDKFQLDQDRRWDAIFRLAQMNDVLALGLVEAESKKDVSYFGKESALRAKALMPDLKSKEKLYETYLRDSKKTSLALQKIVMNNLLPAEQPKFLRLFAPRVLKDLPEFAKSRKVEYSESYSRTMLPAYCSKESVAGLARFIEKNAGLDPSVMKSLRVAKEEDERCVRISSKVSPTL